MESKIKMTDKVHYDANQSGHAACGTKINTGNNLARDPLAVTCERCRPAAEKQVATDSDR